MRLRLLHTFHIRAPGNISLLSRFRRFYLYFLIAAIPLNLAAGPTVTLTPPQLVEDLSDYQDVLEEYAGYYCDDIAAIVSDSLDKPLFMEGFSAAAGVSSVVSGAVRDPGFPFIAVGSAAAVYADSLSPELAGDLASMDPESDMKAGLCIQPVVVNLGSTLPFFGRKIYAGLSAGYIDADAGTYGMKALSAGGFAGARFFDRKPSLVTWEGLSLELGGDWTSNTLTTIAEPGEITEEVPLDPDGEGPLVAQYVTLRVDPVVKAGIDTTLISFRTAVKTGVTFFKALSLTAGGGLAWSWSRSGITVESEDEIFIDSYLDEVVAEGQNGRISIDGTAAELVSTHLIPYLQGGVTFRVGAFAMGVPIVWKPGEALGTGFFAGIRF